MSKYVALVVAVVGLGIWILVANKSSAAEGATFQTQEYVTIRWAGKEHTHLVRASGSVELLSPVLSRTPKPEKTDERAFYMNVAMNAVAREGYEFAGMTD